jgi:hypothetical protein
LTIVNKTIYHTKANVNVEYTFTESWKGGGQHFHKNDVVMVVCSTKSVECIEVIRNNRKIRTIKLDDWENIRLKLEA